MNQYKGLFIVIEGLDGVGKSSTEKILKQNLHKKGVDIVLTHEPFLKYPNGRPYPKGERMYHIIQSPNFARTGFNSRDLFANNAKQHMEKVIKPALEQGKTIVCDRGLLSSLAYQGHYHTVDGQIVDTHHVLQANQKIQGKSMVKPDLNIYLHLDRKDELQRLGERPDKSDAYDKALQNPEKMAKMHRNYQYGLDTMKNKLGVGYRKVDASQSPHVRANEIQQIMHVARLNKSRYMMHNINKHMQSQPIYLTRHHNLNKHKPVISIENRQIVHHSHRINHHLSLGRER